jgi:hypothetical protein
MYFSRDEKKWVVSKRDEGHTIIATCKDLNN